MTKISSTAPRGVRKPLKPKKPHKDFPLTPHPNGLWCKKGKGKLPGAGKTTRLHEIIDWVASHRV